MANKQEQQKLEVSSAKRAYEKGQELSNYTESVIVGYTPIVLNVINFGIALATAGFVAWIMPHMPYGFWKMALFGIAGAVAAMYIASRINFTFQTIGHIRRLPSYAKQAELEPSQVRWIKSKMKMYIVTNIFLSIIALFIMISVHGSFIMIMYTAFSDYELMQELGIEGGEVTYIVTGFAMEIVSALVDVFLGLTTRVRVNVKYFFPDLDEIDTILQKKNDYQVLKKRIEALKAKKSTTTKKKKSSGGGGNSGNQGGGNNNRRGNNIVFDKPSTKLPNLAPLNNTGKLFNKVLMGTTFDETAFEQAISRISDTTRRTRVSSKFATIANKLKDIYSQGHDETNWNANSDQIWRDAKAELEKLTHVMGSIGYYIKKP